MKVKGQVVEQITIVKDVEVEVPDNAEYADIYDAVREKAYEKTILDAQAEHGWDGTSTEGVDVWVLVEDGKGREKAVPIDTFLDDREAK
jgi:hypothetical protein